MTAGLFLPREFSFSHPPAILSRRILAGIILLICGAAVPAIPADDCSYLPKPTPQNPAPEISLQKNCGQLIGEDGFRIVPNHFRNIAFKDGLAELFVGEKVFFVSKTGKTVRACSFDNGADYFSEGLARTQSGGKIGFVNNKLSVIIQPQYDFGFPFQQGKAIVCNGCRPVQVGEHHQLTGGKWGALDRRGQIVIPLEYTRDELEKKLHLQK